MVDLNVVTNCLGTKRIGQCCLSRWSERSPPMVGSFIGISRKSKLHQLLGMDNFEWFIPSVRRRMRVALSLSLSLSLSLLSALNWL